jgi:hypothetical protein
MHRTVPVKDIETGETWSSLADAARALDRTVQAVSQAIIRHGSVAGRHLAYETDEVYCDCCRAKVERRKTLRLNYASIAA